MKKFTSLFALLALVFSASAEVTVYFEQGSKNYTHIYVWDANNNHLAGDWPGDQMTPCADAPQGKTVLKWTYNGDAQIEKVIFNVGSNSSQSPTMVFANNGYYIDDQLDHVVGDDGYSVYFYDDAPWYNVYLHAWKANGPNYNPSGWPGYEMSYYENTPIKYYHVLSSDFSKIIFNNNKGAQTSEFDAVDGMLYSKDGLYTLGLSDESDFSYPMDNFKVSSATYSRECANQWGTLCLPFEFNADQSGVTFYEMTDVTTGENGAITFTPIYGDIEAGQPVAFKLEDDPRDFEGASCYLNVESSDENGVDVVTEAGTSGDVYGWSMLGTFKNTTLDNVYVIQANEIHPTGTGLSIKPYRAWFSGSVSGGAPLRIEVADTEGLQFVEQEDGTVKAYYDLQGRKLDSARKGLVIENGKIIMVK